MSKSSKTRISEAQDCIAKLRRARQRGDLAEARKLLKAARKADPEGGLPGLPLEEAELLRAEGHPEDAQAVLEAAQAGFPNNPWIQRGLADLAWRAGERAATWKHLRLAQALDPERGIAVLFLLEADLLLADGDAAAARAVLEAMIVAHPDNIWGYQRLARLLSETSEHDRASQLLQMALSHAPDNLVLKLELVQFDIATGAWQQATRALQGLLEEHGVQINIVVPLLRCLRRTGALEQEGSLLTEALATYPGDGRLVRYLFETRAVDLAPEALGELTDLAAHQLGEQTAEELRLSVLVRTAEFDAALELIRKENVARRTVSEARQLAQVLFGTRQFRLGLRYVRFCLRRWPTDTVLLDIYVSRGLRQGQGAAIEAFLDQAKAMLPGDVVLAHRLMLHGFRNELGPVLDCYEQLYQRDHVTQAQREIVAKLIYAAQDPATAAPLRERIGRPMAELGKPLHRGGIAGLMTLEFDLECVDLASRKAVEPLGDWVRRRSQSPMPAIRLIDQWRAQQPCEKPCGLSDVSRIPRQIFQYWNQSVLPPAVQKMITRWGLEHGYEHRLFDRRSAVAFLRKTCAPETVRAFQLASSPAEEADLLRLCVMARLGGIWVDADDALYGDLGSVLGQGAGLILYREPLGGAIGNNFIATSPGHPVILGALRIAQEALLRRENETAWNKTGPGVLTRALGAYLAQGEPHGGAGDITILEWDHLACEIATNNPVGYKARPGYWNKAGQRQNTSQVWDVWKSALAVS